MPLVGPEIQPRDIAQAAWQAFHRVAVAPSAVELVEAVAICLAESDGYQRAYHDNVAGGAVTSRDVGLWEINIPAAEIGTDAETGLYPVAANADAMVKIYREGGWERWASFNETTYLYDAYLGRAVEGVGNFLGETLLARPAVELDGKTSYEHAWETPILNFQFRVAAAVGGLTAAEKALGWGSKTKSQVTAIHQKVAAAVVAAKRGVPA